MLSAEVVSLRPFEPPDLRRLYEMRRDADAAWRVAFGKPVPDELEGYAEQWAKRLADSEALTLIVVVDDEVAGDVVRFPFVDGLPYIGYWLGRSWWGRGVGTRAVRLFLDEHVTERPVYAAAAADNGASRRVLEKCGFVFVGTQISHSPIRETDIEEVTLRLG